MKDDKKAYIKTCTAPNTELKTIYEALKFKDRPFTRKTKVVTQFYKLNIQYAVPQSLAVFYLQVGLRWFQ